MFCSRPILRKMLPEWSHVSCVNCEVVRRSLDLIFPWAKSESATSWPEGKPARAPRRSVRTGRFDGSGGSSLLDKRMVDGDKPCMATLTDVSMKELDACGPEVGKPSKNVPHSIR